jgi:hypothetical protein
VVKKIKGIVESAHLYVNNSREQHGAFYHFFDLYFPYMASDPNNFLADLIASCALNKWFNLAKMADVQILN